MTFRITISTRTALVLLVLAVLAIPATAYATHVFADVSDSSVHAEGIEFMKDSGVSIGCQDGTVYCPHDFVTRAQMGTFMYRLSGNDPATAPSVVASGLDGLLFQSVTSNGNLYGKGNALSTTRVSPGHYEVTFDRSVVGCTGVASAGVSGLVAGSVDHATFLVNMGTNVFPTPADTVTVSSFSPNDAIGLIDTGFHLIVICP